MIPPYTGTLRLVALSSGAHHWIARIAGGSQGLLAETKFQLVCCVATVLSLTNSSPFVSFQIKGRHL